MAFFRKSHLVAAVCLLLLAASVLSSFAGTSGTSTFVSLPAVFYVLGIILILNRAALGFDASFLLLQPSVGFVSLRAPPQQQLHII